MAVSTFTWAWINWQPSVPSIGLDSGKLKVSLTSSKVYKYFYPYFAGSTELINYQAAGTVSSEDFSAISTDYKMNLFDPTYLTITQSQGVTISSLNTNLVLAITFSIETSVPATLKFSAVRNSAYTAGTLAASYFIHFQGVTSTVYSGLDKTDYTAADDKVFFPIKTYVEANEGNDATFGEDTNLDIFTFDIDGTSGASSQSVTFYANIDYDDTLTKAVFYDYEHLGYNYDLPMDYSFVLSGGEKV